MKPVDLNNMNIYNKINITKRKVLSSNNELNNEQLLKKKLSIGIAKIRIKYARKIKCVAIN